ncbi:syntaxin-7 isoform X1 [Octopus sinensis]|uniref:Syntaxin-7 isoform X1 n=1 Tax=Octopus sinensis TaxID=2607531 RepID=A0A7E6EUX3_9MOLL|nr:syntaxin-7 isoform X1 [Octopus sinensis]XP_036358766.1 syntaxin-7 isoform X1 [Octopus sinensis]
MSKAGKYGSTVREYRDDPDYGDTRNTDPENSNLYVDEILKQIGNNVFKINNGANNLNKAMKIIGTERDSNVLRDRIHETSQSTNEIVTETANLVKKIVRNRKLTQNRKFELERLRNDFEESFKKFTELQKKAAEKVRTAKPLRPPPGESLIDFEEDDQESLLQRQQREEQLMQQQEIIEEDTALILEREERIRQLEGDILDVNEIFRELGTLVHEQGDVIDSIEANVDNGYSRVESGMQQLTKAASHQPASPLASDPSSPLPREYLPNLQNPANHHSSTDMAP